MSTKILVLICCVLSSLNLVGGDANPASSSNYRKQEQSHHPPPFYYLKHHPPRSCMTSSPEVFYEHVAHPQLSLLYHRGQALFGTLMDNIASTEDLTLIAQTVSNSWDTSVDRLESEWEYFLLVLELIHGSLLLMPWEVKYKHVMLDERLWRIEYGYAVLEAVVRNGVREIVGVVQGQIGGVIRLLEAEVAKMEGEDVTSENLLLQMKKGFAKLPPTFATKLIERVISRSLEPRKPSATFISEPLNQMAIVFHAFREKGADHPGFWNNMVLIFEREFSSISKDGAGGAVKRFVKGLGEGDTLIGLVVELFSGGGNK